MNTNVINTLIQVEFHHEVGWRSGFAEIVPITVRRGDWEGSAGIGGSGEISMGMDMFSAARGCKLPTRFCNKVLQQGSMSKSHQCQVPVEVAASEELGEARK